MGFHWDTGEEAKEEDREGARGVQEHLAEHLRMETGKLDLEKRVIT